MHMKIKMKGATKMNQVNLVEFQSFDKMHIYYFEYLTMY